MPFAASGRTGGIAIVNTNDFSKAFKRISTDLFTYYSLGYTVSSSGSDRVHYIKVELPNHPKYKIRYRRRYVEKSLETRVQDMVMTSLVFDVDHNPMFVEVTAGNPAPDIDIVSVCEAIGARVEVCDPFDLPRTEQILLELLEDSSGVKVLVLKQICALSPEKKSKKMYEMQVDENVCLGENCGCNRLCTRIFKCPGLNWDATAGVARIDEVICAGCGVCASICPAGAISKKEVA